MQMLESSFSAWDAHARTQVLPASFCEALNEAQYFGHLAAFNHSLLLFVGIRLLYAHTWTCCGVGQYKGGNKTISRSVRIE